MGRDVVGTGTVGWRAEEDNTRDDNTAPVGDGHVPPLLEKFLDRKHLPLVLVDKTPLGTVEGVRTTDLHGDGQVLEIGGDEDLLVPQQTGLLDHS
mmetsp:Transcript_6973/g.10151  ORF Transcript_6973/g.10151 Transcript_6973/m.10151 type:complete len:95 (-) Transcript_6973:571-855(-)